MRYTDEALEAAAKLAARHLRDYKLPDSAIDLIDEAGAKMRLKTGARARAARETTARGRSSRSAPSTWKKSSRGWRASRPNRRRRPTRIG